MLFGTVNKLLQKKTVRRYPSAQDNEILANRFADFFQENISNIYQSLSARLQTADETPYAAETCPVLIHDLRVVSIEQVRGFASKSSCKSCNLDLLPPSVVKACLYTLFPVITWIVSLSLTKGAMPESFKLAELLSSLKKPDVDYEDFKSFRPISNLPMVSKVIEKPAADQFTRHVLTGILMSLSSQHIRLSTQLKQLSSKFKMTSCAPLTVGTL